MTRLRAAGMLAALLAIPSIARASDTQDALKLAERIASQGVQHSVVALRALPPDFPPDIPLPKATLLGSVAQKPAVSQGSGWMVVGTGASFYYDTADRDGVVAAYVAALRSAGWTERRLPFDEQGGFARVTPGVWSWCRSGDHAAYVALIVGDEPTAITVHVQTEPRAAALSCAQQDDMSASMPRSPLPRFTAAHGVTVERSGPTNDGTTTAARIASSLGAPAVFDAFAKQLTAAGWTTNEPAHAAGVVSGTFRKTVDGVPYVTLLSLYALDATHYVALADVSNVTPNAP